MSIISSNSAGITPYLAVIDHDLFAIDKEKLGDAKVTRTISPEAHHPAAWDDPESA